MTDVDRAYDVFVAAPMSAHAGDDDYQRTRNQVLTFITTLKSMPGLDRVYFAGQDLPSVTQFATQQSALAQDISALRNSRMFCLIYPERLASSVLVEAGYALAIGMPCVLFTRKRGDLPYLLVDAEAHSVEGIPAIRIVEYGDRDPAAVLRGNSTVFQF
jgi:hypothetical protein